MKMIWRCTFIRTRTYYSFRSTSLFDEVVDLEGKEILTRRSSPRLLEECIIVKRDIDILFPAHYEFLSSPEAVVDERASSLVGLYDLYESGLQPTIRCDASQDLLKHDTGIL